MTAGRAPRRVRSTAIERLIAALAEPGCPVCRCLEADARRDLAAFLREQVMDPAGRAALRAAGGLCGWHTGLLREASDGILSVAILADALLHPGAGSGASCPACAQLRESEPEYLQGLLEPVPALGRSLEAGPGLPCRPHLRRIRAIAPSDAVLTTLHQAIGPRLARLRADLAAFIAKQDYRAREAPTAEEARAWGEALEHLAGRPAFFGSDLARL